MLPPDKDWSLKKAREIGPTGFSRRRLDALSIEQNPDPLFSEMENEHDLEIEAQALRMYLIDHQLKHDSSPEEALESWVEIDDEEKDYYRLSIEKVLALSDSPKMADDLFNHLASELAFGQS